MTANSLGRTLIGALGIWLLPEAILLLSQLPFLVLSGAVTHQGMPGLMESLMFLAILGQPMMRLLLAVVLIAFRGTLADWIFGKDEEVSVDTSARDLIALLLLGLGIWYLVGGIQNILSFVEWGPTPYGFPFRFGPYPANSWVPHVIQAVLGVVFISRCGWISRRFAKVQDHE